MAGSGITEDNISRIAEHTGAKQFHSTAKTTVVTAMTYRSSGDLAALDGDFAIMETSSAKVEMMKQSLAEVFNSR